MRLFVALLIWSHFAQATAYEKQIRSGLAFMKAHQSDGHDGYDEGQWPAQVTGYVPTMIGIGKLGVPYEEPTQFLSASVANVLAEIYFENPGYDQIPEMVYQSGAALDNYRWGSLFHYYPPKTFKGIPTRGPRFMWLARQWQGLAYITPDADTTSLTYTYLHYRRNILAGTSPLTNTSTLPAKTLNIFSNTRDLNRRPHSYNALQGQFNTGAFMTWLWNERDPHMPRNYFSTPDHGPRIPFNKNDVDCVVNANVLKMLTFAGETGGPGYKAACAHLNRLVDKRQFYNCGMYYPNNFVLPYSMATTLHSGATCLERSRSELLQYLLRKQQPNGGWHSQLLVRMDHTQATVWALNALMTLGDVSEPRHRRAVQAGLEYLLRQAERDSAGNLFWRGQVYFAAIFAARFSVVWRSTAYTTALALKALTQAERWQ